MSAETEQKLSDLVSSAAQDVSALVRGEIALAKAEVRRTSGRRPPAARCSARPRCSACSR
jgi:hypothetical protein